MGKELWRCIEQHVHRNEPGLQRKVLAADIARATGLSDALVSNLKRKQELPKPTTLAAVRDGLGIPYRTLLDAALTDRGWLPEPPVGHRKTEADRAVGIAEAALGQGTTEGDKRMRNPPAS